MRSVAATIAIAGALVAAGCGGGGSESTSATTGAALPEETLESLWRSGGSSIGAVPSTSDHGRGRNRVSFLVVDEQSRFVEAPTARVWISRGLEEPPFAGTTARLVTIGVPGGEKGDAQRLYVATMRLPAAGTYWYVAIPNDTSVHAAGNVIVKPDADAPEVGERAVPSATPTLRSTGGDLNALSTSRKPNPALYRSSVEEAMAARAPFVVSFATPLYCQTRLCGPVVDVVGAAQKRFAGSGVRFIHVEVYRDNDPAKGVNPWLEEWNLPTEPWTFVVDRTGVVRARFENAMSLGELVAAVKRVA